MFTTPQDYFKALQSTFAAIPKTAEDIKTFSTKAQAVLATETETAKEVLATYNKAASLFNENELSQIIMAIVAINAWNRIAITTKLIVG